MKITGWKKNWRWEWISFGELRDDKLIEVGNGVNRKESSHKLSILRSVGTNLRLKLSKYQFIFVRSYMCITKREEMTTYFRIPCSSMHSINLVCLTFKRFGISNMIQMQLTDEIPYQSCPWEKREREFDYPTERNFAAFTFEGFSSHLLYLMKHSIQWAQTSNACGIASTFGGPSLLLTWPWDGFK